MLIAKTIRSFSKLQFKAVANLSEEMKSFQEGVNAFTQKSVLPLADETDRRDEFPMHLWKEMGEFGLLGLTCPEKYGGVELGYVANTCSFALQFRI